MQDLTLLKRSLLGTASLALALSIGAHAESVKKIEKSKIKVTAPIKIDATKKAPQGKAVGERFRLWLSVNATDCNDPVLLGNLGKDDHVFEMYGELRVNDKTEWRVARQMGGAAQPGLSHHDLPSSSKVDPRKQGFTLNSDPFVFQDKHEIKVDTSKSGIAHITLQLFDKDDPQGGLDYKYSEQGKVDRKDDQIGDYKIDLDLGALGKGDGHYYWYWSSKDESGNPIGTNLYLMAEHVGTIYAMVSDSPTKTHIDPKIIEKKFPRKTPGAIDSKAIPKKSEPTPAPKETSKPPAKGRQVKITARFLVTNAEDGVGDNVVELLGSIYINGSRVFSFDKTKAAVGKVFMWERAVRSAYYYGGNSNFAYVRGVIEDHDSGSGNDTMWVADQRINIEQILNSHNEFLIKGDRSSENGDLYIRVEDLGEFYE